MPDIWQCRVPKDLKVHCGNHQVLTQSVEQIIVGTLLWVGRWVDGCLRGVLLGYGFFARCCAPLRNQQPTRFNAATITFAPCMLRPFLNCQVAEIQIQAWSIRCMTSLRNVPFCTGTVIGGLKVVLCCCLCNALFWVHASLQSNGLDSFSTSYMRIGTLCRGRWRQRVRRNPRALARCRSGIK